MSDAPARTQPEGPRGRVRRREFMKGAGLAVAGSSILGEILAGRPEPCEAAAARGPLEAPAGAERVYASADNEGLINVHVVDGRIVRVSSLDYPNNLASPMALNWHHRTYASDRILYPMVRADWAPGGGGKRETRGVPRYRRASWNEALDLVAQELKRVKTTYGNESIFGGMIGGWSTTGLLNTKTGQLARFLGLYGGYTNRIGNKSYAAWQWAAPYSWGVIFPDDSWADTVANSNLLIAWGSDPMNVQKVVGPLQGRTNEWIASFKQRGGKLITIDPLYSDTAEVSQQWIPIRPGTDAALGAAMAYVMITENLYSKEFVDRYTVGFEPFRQYVMGESDRQPKTPEWAAGLTDVPADTIRALAREFATTPRVKITTGFGIQRQDHGEQQVRMLITLAAMKGEFGLAGAGLTASIPGFGSAGDARVKGTGPTGFPGVPNPVTQLILDQQFANAVLNPPMTMHHNGNTYQYPQPGKSEIKLIYWVGGSTLNQHDQVNRNLEVFRKMETIIIQDSWWTPSARHADIVLPINTLLERDDISQTWRYIVYQHKVIDPLGESKSDFEVFTALSARLGFKDKFTMGLETDDQWLRKIYATAKLPMTYERFKEVGRYLLPIDETPYVAFADFRKDPGANPLNTPSGKIEIYSAAIAKLGYDDCPPTPQWMEPFEWLGSPKAATYPFHLITKHPIWRRHSSYDNVQELHQYSKVNGYEPVLVNPRDAAARGIQTGDVVRVFNDRGQVLAAAVVSERIRPQVALLHEGSWYTPAEPGRIGSLDRGGCTNVLTSQRGTSQLAQGPVAYTNLVQIEKHFGGERPNEYTPIVSV